MELDTRWANMVDEDPQLLVELMAHRLESKYTTKEDQIFVEGIRYALELLQNRTILIQDSFTLFEEK